MTNNDEAVKDFFGSKTDGQTTGPGKIVQMFTFMNQAPAVLTESGDIFVLQMKEPEPDSKKVDIFWDHIQPPTAADLSKVVK